MSNKEEIIPDSVVYYLEVNGKPLTDAQKKEAKKLWNEYNRMPSNFVLGKRRR